MRFRVLSNVEAESLHACRKIFGMVLREPFEMHSGN
jgi:hypothetical protein